MTTIARPPLIALVPIEPRPTGNGLAMRAAHVLGAAAREFELLVVVVPVTGAVPLPAPTGSGRAMFVRLDPPSELRSGSLRLLADPLWRARLEAAQPLPGLARTASPGWADTVSRQILSGLPPLAAGAPLHVMRSYLAPLGLAVAERIGAPWATLDLDDDDVAYEVARGRPEESEAFERLMRTFPSQFSAVAAASPSDASKLARRYGFPVATIPNTVAIPPRRSGDRPMGAHILYVGNLTYEPNVEAVRMLVSVVLPRLRELVDPPVSVTLVGGYRTDGPLASLEAHPDVTLTGAVADLGEFYDQAAVVVAPLPPGGATKIKILEAFAHGVPVVTTPSGAAGLDVGDGTHLLIGTDAEQLAQRTAEVLLDRALARRLATDAFAYVVEHHAPGIADRAVGRFLRAAAGSEPPGRSRR